MRLAESQILRKPAAFSFALASLVLNYFRGLPFEYLTFTRLNTLHYSRVNCAWILWDSVASRLGRSNILGAQHVWFQLKGKHEAYFLTPGVFWSFWFALIWVSTVPLISPFLTLIWSTMIMTWTRMNMLKITNSHLEEAYHRPYAKIAAFKLFFCSYSK